MLDGFLVAAAGQFPSAPGMFVRPIATVFGIIINFLFNIVYFMTPAHALGLTVILATIVMRVLMLPLNLNMQKSMAKMREIQPELNKIKEKYGDSKDPEIKRKMAAEQQALMSKHGANPLKGCFPMLLTMPVFIGFNFILRHAFMYIRRLETLYYDISAAILRVPDILGIIAPAMHPNDRAMLPEYYADAIRLIPDSLNQAGAQAYHLLNQGHTLESVREQVGDFIMLTCPTDMSRVISLFTPENWDWLYSQIPQSYAADIIALNAQRTAIETFFGLDMVSGITWTWPSVLIPFLVGITMMISMYIGNLRNAAQATDDRMKMQQKLMLIIMPVFIGFITFGMAAGVGLFWITSQVIQGIQDLVLNKKAGVKFVLPFMKKEDEAS